MSPAPAPCGTPYNSGYPVAAMPSQSSNTYLVDARGLTGGRKGVKRLVHKLLNNPFSREWLTSPVA